MARVLILCPTFDHAEALYASIASVRAQTVTDWEMVVVGDGAPARTHEVVAAIAAGDARVRATWHPKSERFGEAYRDPVIRASRAEFVCHLSDDDIWLPQHLETMLALLADADWANQAPLRLQRGGGIDWWPLNHGTPAMRAAIRRRAPLSAGLNYVAYRREAYLRLAEGWTCAPWSAGTSDVYMWAKFFAGPPLRVASSAVSTALKFPSHVPDRARLPSVDRLLEILPWLARSTEPGLAESLRRAGNVERRLVMLFAVHEAAAADSLEGAFAACGLQPVPAEESPAPAIDGAPMRLPLTQAQRAQAERAWWFVRSVANGDDDARAHALHLYADDAAGWERAEKAIKALHSDPAATAQARQAATFPATER